MKQTDRLVPMTVFSRTKVFPSTSIGLRRSQVFYDSENGDYSGVIDVSAAPGSPEFLSSPNFLGSPNWKDHPFSESVLADLEMSSTFISVSFNSPSVFVKVSGDISSTLPASSGPPEQSGVNGVTVGVITGGLLFVILVIALIIFLRIRWTNQHSETEYTSSIDGPPIDHSSFSEVTVDHEYENVLTMDILDETTSMIVAELDDVDDDEIVVQLTPNQ
jgi:hypothetical protein